MTSPELWRTVATLWHQPFRRTSLDLEPSSKLVGEPSGKLGTELVPELAGEPLGKLVPELV